VKENLQYRWLQRFVIAEKLVEAGVQVGKAVERPH